MIMITILIIIIIFVWELTHKGIFHGQIQDLIFAVALRFKDHTFHASGHRVENYSSRYYSFLNDERYGIECRRSVNNSALRTPASPDDS